MTSYTILTSPALDAKMLKALLMLLCLKGIAKGFIIGSVLAVCLFFYTMVADALVEVTSNLADLWMHGDSIIKLLMLCLAVYIAKKLFPYILLLHRKGLV